MFSFFFSLSLKDFLVFYSLKYASFSSQRYTFIRKLLVRWWFGFSCLFYFKFCYVYISLKETEMIYTADEKFRQSFFFCFHDKVFFFFFKAIFNLLRCEGEWERVRVMIWWKSPWFDDSESEFRFACYFVRIFLLILNQRSNKNVWWYFDLFLFALDSNRGTPACLVNFFWGISSWWKNTFDAIWRNVEAYFWKFPSLKTFSSIKITKIRWNSQNINKFENFFEFSLKTACFLIKHILDWFWKF